MNEYQQSLYNGLMNLMDIKDKPFFFEDTHIGKNLKYRVFCYLIPGYAEYQLPYAKETRGAMFLLDARTDKMLEMVAHPMPKFFTYGEQPETANLDLSKAKRFTLKPDGSLLTTYIDAVSGKLTFKTKRKPQQSSFDAILEQCLYPEFLAELDYLTRMHHCSVDCELTSPENRVILSYDEPKLTLLKVRNRLTGDFVDIHSQTFQEEFPELAKHVVEELSLDLLKDLNKKNRFLELKGIEGGVVEMEDGTLAKIKTMYYLTQNRYANIQDLSKRDRLLLEACLEETFDELRTLFHYRKRSENYDLDGILKAMDSIEKQVNELYNPFHAKIMNFYEENKSLPVNEFIEKTKNGDMKEFMSVLVPMHKGQKVNLKSIFIKMYGKRIKVRD